MLPVIYYPPARNYFKKLRDRALKKKFEEAVMEIRNNPQAGQRKVGDLTGIYGYDIYHNGTNYEIAYSLTTLDDGAVLIVIMAGTRENFWDELKKYIL